MAAAIVLKNRKFESKPSPLNPKLTAIGSSSAQLTLVSSVFYGLKKFTKARNGGQQEAEDSLRMVVYLSSWGPY
ncbi:hypothetical protein CCACVL1_12960 [Corchorus capsularis]|uniref:Uncharacterized protein n=1 Tax=Corchorus capsularis TaxID=210143 RepID=A0A1R3ID03_COCAP|nr:hypothetical protein CCACVL1_12960 [Corchorus capsularis]